MPRLIVFLEIPRVARTLARDFANLVTLVPRDELGLATIDHVFLLGREYYFSGLLCWSRPPFF